MRQIVSPMRMKGNDEDADLKKYQWFRKALSRWERVG